MKTKNKLELLILRWIYSPLFTCACNRILEGRLIEQNQPERGRWLKSDVKNFKKKLWPEVQSLLEIAQLETIPTFGNRHNVFLAVVTTAAYRTLLNMGISPAHSRVLLSDVGWKVYKWLLLMIYKPVSFTTRNPQKKLERALKALMVFPFNSPGKPGYEVKAWSQAGNYHTLWTNCPPQNFVRKLLEEKGDHGELEAFYQSWCLYDWAGADLLSGGTRGDHYSRPETMSKGAKQCDMCWRANPSDH